MFNYLITGVGVVYICLITGVGGCLHLFNYRGTGVVYICLITGVGGWFTCV